MIVLKIYENDKPLKILRLDSGKFILGRTRDCDVFIHDQAISRRHAELTVAGDPPVITVTDLGSANGFTFDGQKSHRATLELGQAIEIGRIRVVFAETRDAPEAAKAGLEDEIPHEIRDAAALQIPAAAPLSEPVFPGNDQDSIPGLLKIRPRDGECRAMVEVAKTLNGNLKLQEILALVGKVTGRTIEADGCAVLLYDKKTGTLSEGLSEEEEPAGTAEIFFSRTLAGHVVKRQVPMLIKSVRNDDTFGACRSLAKRNATSVICVPLSSPEGTLGALYADRCANGVKNAPFDEDDLMFVTNIGTLASAALVNARLRERVDRETRRRINLERYVSPQLVDDIVDGGRNLELGGRKTTVTILFSDIRNFTKISEPMAPKDVVRLLNEYFSAMTEIIFDNSGTLDKFIGDEIMATFGVPLENPRHAEQAVKTALAMMKSLRELKTSFLRKMLPIFEIGIGINSGEVVSGNIGSMKRMEYTVIGDAVNTASRLVSAARPGQIIVNETTYELTRENFVFNPLPPIEVKGKTGKLRIFEVVSLK